MNPLKNALCESTPIVKARDQHQFHLRFEIDQPNAKP